MSIPDQDLRTDNEGKDMALLPAARIRVIGGLLALLMLVGGVGAWVQRERLLSWYYLRRLAQAQAQDGDRWAERVSSLGEIAVPGLLDYLMRDDDQLCTNVRKALGSICGRLPQDDARWQMLMDRIVEVFPRLSGAGQRCVLALAGDWLRPAAQPSAATLAFGRNLLNAASQTSDSAARGIALDIAGALLDSESQSDTLDPCRALARACFNDSDPMNRQRAVHLALYPHLDLLAEVAPLLRDPAVEVRRAVVLAVGTSRAGISDERLALALHDPDAEVRRLCEKALLGRGLTRCHVQLARLITDSRPKTRARVLFHLREDADLDLTVWLRLLTQDPADLVRFAAIRAIAERGVGELNERLEQMANSDPNPTISLWARYYADRLKQLQASNGRP
jgi:HEAT repeat protein